MSDLPRPLVATLVRRIALGIQREYPNKLVHALKGDTDLAPPRELTPAFFGCFDWHSAVHGHWTLARLCRVMPTAAFVPEARALLDASLTPGKLAGELAYLEHPEHGSFELPYGIAWLLTLSRELAEWDDADARRWHAHLMPLATLGAARMLRYLERLPYPVRSGEHAQTAFGAGLFLDFAQGSERAAAAARVRALFAGDRDAPLHLEPSGFDFLSPSLAEADVMRRVMPPAELASWLTQFLPSLSRHSDEPWLSPVSCPDRSDGKLVHLDGLNASRAWMLAGIASGLPRDDVRRPALLAAAEAHETAAVAGLDSDHYAGTHWLGTFAVYLSTRRGL